MNCPECGSPTEIIDTQKYETVVWRRRRCSTHNHRFNTHETVVEAAQNARTKKQPEPQPKPEQTKVTPLPVRNPRKRIEDLREYLEQEREDIDDRC